MIEDESIYYDKVNQNNPAFDGATYNWKLEHKKIFTGENDQILYKELFLLQRRSQALIRNSPFGSNARNTYLQMLGDLTVTWVDKNNEKVPEMQAIWEEFEENCCLDGKGNLKTLIATAHSDEFINGSSFIRFQFRPTNTTLPLKLEGISSNLHAYTYFGKDGISYPNLLKTRFGITFEDTAPSIYHFFPDLWDIEDYTNLSLIDIQANEILHNFNRIYPGQWLGIPILSSVLLIIYSIEDLIDATVAKQQAAAAITWVVKNNNPLIQSPTGSPLTVKDKDGKEKVIFRSQGGGTQYLNRGEELNLVQSSDIGNNLADFIKHINFVISAALGIPYHIYTGDTNGLNFSSIRSIMVEMRKKIEYIHFHQTVPNFYKPITNKVNELTRFYKPKTPKATPKFHLPRWRGVDDLKDAQADLLEVTSGLNTIENIQEERGVTFDEVVKSFERILNSPLKVILEQGMGQSGNVEANTNSSSN